MYKMTTDGAGSKDPRPPGRRQQASLPTEASTEQLRVPDAGSEAKPARRVYRPRTTTKGQPEEAEEEARTAPTFADSSVSKSKTGSVPSAASDPREADDGLQPPPGAYRVGLEDESRIEGVGLLMPAPVAPDSMRMVHEAAENRTGPQVGGSIANHSEVSSLTSRSIYTHPTQPSIQAELVEANAVSAAVIATPDLSTQYESTTAGGTAAGGATADETLTNDVDELRKQVDHNSFQNKVLLIVLIVVVLIAIAVGVTVALLVTGGGDDPTPAPTIEQALVTSAPTVRTPAPTPSDPLTREDIEAVVVEQSPTTTFEVGTTARQALDWLTGDAFSQGLMSAGDLTKLLQRFGLAVLYFSSEGQNWKTRTGWLEGTDECVGWHGVICSNSLVTQLSQQSNRLKGPIPIELLLFLKNSVAVFNLARNDLEGTIPTEVGALLQLTDLRLHENELVGPIPAELADLSLLRHLAFTLNDLTGTVPPIPELSQLTFLDIRDNPQLRGPLPNDFRGLDSLEQVYLFGTELSGTLSSELCDTLETAWIDCGEIECACCTGNLDAVCPSEPSPAPTAAPTVTGATPAPTAFPTRTPTSPPTTVGGTSPPSPPPTVAPTTGTPPPTVVDTLPPTAGTPPPTLATSPPSRSPTHKPTLAPVTPPPTSPARAFRDVILQYSPGSSIDNSGSPAGKAFNWIEGDPFSKSQLDSNNDVSVLQRFALATLFYSLNGESGWSNRGWLDNESECVGWNTEDLQCSDSRISVVDLNDINNGVVAGSLPAEVGLLTALTKLNIARNDVGGRIPTQLGSLVRLTDLRLFENNLVGPLPNQLSSLVELRHLAVTLNALTGRIPGIFNGMSKLTFLDLRDNKFAGALPGGMEGMDSLKFLYLFNTDVSGTLPSELCDTLEDAWIDCGEIACDCCTARFGEVEC